MNLLKYRSKLLAITSRNFRTFSASGKSPSDPTRVFVNSTRSNNDLSDSQKRSNSQTSSKNKSTETKTNTTNSSQASPEQFISIDPKFNAFSSTGPVSGFYSSESIDSNSTFTSSAKGVTDETVSAIKDLTDQAVDTTKQTVYATTSSSTAKDFTDSATNTAQELVYTAANIAGSTVKGFADVAGSVTSSLSSNAPNPIDLVGSTLRGIGDVAATVASVFIPTQSQRDYNERYRDRYSDYDRRRNDSRSNVGLDFASTTIRGLTDLAGSVASTFIPGAQSSSYRGSRDTNIVGTIVNNTAQSLSDTARGLAEVAGTIASNVIPGIQQFVPGNTSVRSKTSGQSSANENFVYTGSQVEDLTFTDANKKGEVSSGSTTQEILDTVRNVTNTATAAAQDTIDMASSAARKFATDASKGAVSAANDFARSAGSAALSAAASAARRFNAAASATDVNNDEAQEGFIYTGTQMKEDLTFDSTENQTIDAESKRNIRIRQNTSYDVVISGAGLSGSALACALGHYRHFSKEDKRILLLDPRESPSLQDFHNSKSTVPAHRVVALSQSSVNFLKELGVWSLLNRNRIGSIHQMQVWETGGNSFVKFNENPSREMGYAIESEHLQAALYERLKAMENIKLEIPNKITDIKNDTRSSATVILDDEEKVSAKLVVGSDSQNSVVKNKAKIASTGWSPHQYGILCTVKTPYHNTTAWQRFLSTGPLAILPLWDEYNSVIWSCEYDIHQTLMQASDEDFLRELNYNLTRKSEVNTPNIVFSRDAGFDIPPLLTEICNQRKSFPLSTQQANQYVSNRIALIGDAAHTVHPLAGQGVNMGLTDAAYLANVIIKNLKAGNDIGNVELLREYEAASMNLNTAMIYSMEFVKRTYESNNYNPVVFARNLAVSAVNNFGPVKSLFIDVANGKYFQPLDYEWKTVG